MSAAALSVANVSVSFGPLKAVDDVSLEVGNGKVLALIGPNGAGKTTLLNAVSGLLPVDEGAMYAGGREITSASARERPAFGIKRTFQHAMLSNELTVLENVLVGASTAQYPRSLLAEWLRLPSEMKRLAAERERALAILDRLELAELAHMPATEISFGRKKLVDLARAMMTDPKVLLLDEPTAGLSEHEVTQLADLISHIRKSAAILLVAHHMGFVNKVADHVVCLVTGRVISSGTSQAVQSDPKVLTAYMGTAA